MRANLDALRLLRKLQDEDRYATGSEQQVLARWSSWGAVPAIFDSGNDTYATAREELRDLLEPGEYRAAQRTTINAHYTDPAYAGPLWDVLADLGLRGGHVLEPGCGAGTFIGLAPRGIRTTGIELDPVTAAIAAQLYPSATIRAESFADTPHPDGTFDAVVGNVPFGDITLHDPTHNRGRHSLHNHFIVKSLALTRPGGIVAVLTSRYTLDATSTAARDEMYAAADLLGAVRLPTGAHRRAAGTDAVTDVLILRKRLPGEQPGPNTWITTRPATVGDASVPLNGYFHDHPTHVLGDLHVGPGMYGAQTLQVRPHAGSDGHAVHDALVQALGQVSTAARAAGRAYAPPEGGDSTGITTRDMATVDEQVLPDPVARTGTAARFDGFVSHQDGQFLRQTRTGPEPLAVPASRAAELTALLGLRDSVTDLLAAEAADSADTDPIAGLRADLNARYDTYTVRYGPINRFTLTRTGRTGEDGRPVMSRRVPPAVRIFKADPFAPPVLGLEVFDDATQTASKSAIFNRRVVAPRLSRTTADSPADALAISMDTYGQVHLDAVARLLGTTAVQARQRLGTLVYDDPTTQDLVPAAEYLSGNVRTKLAAAQTAAQDDPDLAVNVDALLAALPVDLGPDEISVRLGAVWVPADDVAAFLQDTLGDPTARVEHPGGSTWAVTGNRHTVAATSTWGTDRLDALSIVERVMAQKRVIVEDAVVVDARETRVINPVASVAAQEKAAALNDRFSEWIWQDPARADRLARLYNDTFNSLVLRSYDTDHMTLPGLALSFRPRPHQLAAVARMVAEPSVGLYHEVGAGKTAELVIGVQELRRLGLVRKPAIVVPNHMLEQFAREYLQLYPQANILAASSQNLRADQRAGFVGRIATGDWDAVIMTRTAFSALPVSVKAEADYLDQQVQTIRDQHERAREHGTRSLTVKGLEKRLQRAEERLKAKLDTARDAGITFEETGIDYLAVDELHDYKNLAITSNIQGVDSPGSQRAADLDMKIEMLRARHGGRGRVITGATATPIANSVSEAYVMQRYLRPDLLHDAGITDFDSWAATFGQQVTEIELAPAGGGNYRTTTRFAKFQNVPELLRLWHVSADIKTAEDLNLPTPALVPRPDGHRAPETVVIPASQDLRTYVAHLGERAEQVRAKAVAPDQDNMLKITGDGRKAALDMRMVGDRTLTTTAVDTLTPTLVDRPGAAAPAAGGRPLGHDVSAGAPEPTKLDVAAERIHRIWAEHRDRTFVAADGEPHPAPGALQLVFCDLGTPNPGRWNAYDTLRDTLTAHGMDPTRIRFVHDAGTDAQKAALFEACRTGAIDVIIGSTSRMGVGTNIQARAVALHHLDCPWRPADIAQREGRILRQGNQNPEVQILRYVVEGSFDAYSWQTVERKAKFIAQVMKGSLDVREIDDVGDTALSYNEVKALASGDPRVLHRAQAEADVTRLERLARAHQRNQTQLRHTADHAVRHLDDLREQVPALEMAITARRDTRGDAFQAVLNGTTHTDRASAATALRHRLLASLQRLAPQTRRTAHLDEVLTLGGHTFDADLDLAFGTRSATLTVRDVPTPGTVLTEGDLIGDGHGPITRLENKLNGLDRTLDQTQQQITNVANELAQARDGIGQPFPRNDELTTARGRLHDLVVQMQRTAHAQPAHQQPPRATGSDDSAGITPASEGREATVTAAAAADEDGPDRDIVRRSGADKVRAAAKEARRRSEQNLHAARPTPPTRRGPTR